MLRLMAGITFGVSINSRFKPAPEFKKNYARIKSQRHFIHSTLTKEYKLGWLGGPSKTRPRSAIIITPLGVIPKDNGKIRVICDFCASANDWS